MLALSFWRPWPYVILHEDPEIQKRFENRTWRPNKKYLGQQFALHAAKTYDATARDFIVRVTGRLIPNYQPSMAIVGIFRLMGWFDHEKKEEKLYNYVTGTIELVNNYFPDPVKLSKGQKWMCGPIVLILDDICRLDHPVPCKGRQGIWTLPPDIEKQVREQQWIPVN